MKVPRAVCSATLQALLIDKEYARSESPAKAGIRRRKTSEMFLLLIPVLHVRGKEMDNLIFRM